MRHFHYLLNYSRYNYYFFNYLFDLDYFWYLDHLLYDLFYEDWNLLDSINNSRNLNYSFLNLFDYLGHFDININKFLNFYDLWLSHDEWLL